MGRIMRDIDRKAENPNAEINEVLEKMNKLFHQKKGDTNKLYCLHASEVECIQKGKVHKKFEFGCKVGFITTSKNNWIVSAKAFHGNPYDGHTLSQSIEQMVRYVRLNAKISMKIWGIKERYHYQKILKFIYLEVKIKKITPWDKIWLRRRNAIEPIFSHAKHYHRMNGNHLLGKEGDRINAISAVGCNFKKLLLAFSFCLNYLWKFIILNISVFNKYRIIQGRLVKAFFLASFIF